MFNAGTYISVIERMFDNHTGLSPRDIVRTLPAFALILRNVHIPLICIVIEQRLCGR
jgi:hypothetical protein